MENGVEQNLEIYTTKNGDKEYNNIYLTTRVDKRTGEPKIGLKPGNFITVKKKYAEGYRQGAGESVYYSCAVIYKDKEVGFLLNEKNHELFKNCGGEGDTIRISFSTESFTNKAGKEVTYNKFSFVKVE